MTTEQEKILARVRKMLCLANDAGASEGERDNAMRMAHATLAKYNLDMAQAEAEGGETTQGEERVQTRAEFFGRPWARVVAASTAELFFCHYLFISATRAKNTKHIFIGRRSNAITAGEMAKYLVESIMREGRKHQRSEDADNSTFRAFCWGAAMAIKERVKKLRKESEQERPTIPHDRALVLASVYANEAAANQALVKQMFPVLRKARRGKDIHDAEAFEQGKAYGNTVSLARQLRG